MSIPGMARLPGARLAERRGDRPVHRPDEARRARGPAALPGRAGGRRRRLAACAASSWAWIWPWRSLTSPSSSLLGVLDPRQRLLVWLAGGGQVALAGLELGLGPLELGLLRGDLVPRRPHLGDRVPGLVAQLSDALGDRGVLVLDRGAGTRSGWQIVESLRIQDHGERVGLARLIDRDQPLAEHLERALQADSQHLEPTLGLLELGLGLVEPSLDDRLPVAQAGDLAAELVEPVAVALDGRREHSLARLCLLELRLLLLELGLQILRRARRPRPAARRRSQPPPKAMRRVHERGVGCWVFPCLDLPPTGLAVGLARVALGPRASRPLDFSPLWGKWFPAPPGQVRMNSAQMCAAD